MFRCVSLFLLAAACQAATVYYSSQANFNAALGGAVTTVDFAGIGGGGSDVPMNNYTESGATFTGAGGYLYGRSSSGGFIYGPRGNNISIALPAGTIGVGLNLNRFYGTTHDYFVQLSNGDTFTLSGGAQFAGFISTDALTSVQVKTLTGPAQGIYNLTSDYVMLYDVSFSSVPEPSSWALTLAGVALLVRARIQRA